MEMEILSAAIMISLAAVSAAFGNSNLFTKYVESVARQPEVGGKLFGQVMILFGLIEALPIIAAGMGILILFGIV